MHLMYTASFSKDVSDLTIVCEVTDLRTMRGMLYILDA